jgi:hypothetical protein
VRVLALHDRTDVIHGPRVGVLGRNDVMPNDGCMNCMPTWFCFVNETRGDPFVKKSDVKTSLYCKSVIKLLEDTIFNCDD